MTSDRAAGVGSHTPPPGRDVFWSWARGRSPEPNLRSLEGWQTGRIATAGCRVRSQIPTTPGDFQLERGIVRCTAKARWMRGTGASSFHHSGGAPPRLHGRASGTATVVRFFGTGPPKVPQRSAEWRLSVSLLPFVLSRPSSPSRILLPAACDTRLKPGSGRRASPPLFLAASSRRRPFFW